MAMIAAAIELSEPWDWNPPTVELEIDESDASGGWPVRCVITSASDVEPSVGRVHPHLPNGSQALVGQKAELSLRHQHGAPPDVADGPTVYFMVVVPEVRLEPVLIGYGPIQTRRPDDA